MPHSHSRLRLGAALLAMGSLTCVPLLAQASDQPATRLAPLHAADSAVAQQYIVRTTLVSNRLETAKRVHELSSTVERSGGRILVQYPNLGGFAATLTEAQLTSLRKDPRVRDVFANGTRTLTHNAAMRLDSDEARQQPPAPTGRPVPKPTIPPFPDPKPVPLPAGPGTQSNAVWGIDRIDQRSLPLDKAYNYKAAGRNVNVYIMDTGVATKHQEFAGRVAGGMGWSTVGGTFTNSYEDCSGHGTHVAGIAAGRNVGVARGANIYSLRIFNCEAKNEDKDLLAALDWSLTNVKKPAVINMSFGDDKAKPISGPMEEAVKKLIDSGIPVVAAAGNEAKDACQFSPASVPTVITVGNTDDQDSYAPRSNFGACVDLGAPGTSITSAMYGTPNMTSKKSGTSMAAPHVAGAVALYLEGHPAATPAEIAAALTSSATKDVLKKVPAGTPNLLLYTADIVASK